MMPSLTPDGELVPALSSGCPETSESLTPLQKLNHYGAHSDHPMAHNIHFPRKMNLRSKAYLKERYHEVSLIIFTLYEIQKQ